MRQADEGDRESEILCPSLAICLVDDYNGAPPRGRVDVFVRGQNKKAVRNLGSCFTFFKLSSQPKYTVQVKSEYYFDLELCMETNHGELPPVHSLIPLPSYPFPQGETLVRGTLFNSNGNAICNAEISSAVEALTFKGRTDNRGDFSVYFKSLKRENFSKDGCYIVSSEDNNLLSFKLSYPDQEEPSIGPLSGILKNIKAGIANSKGNGALIELK